jgi:hypothetical protein
MCIFSHCLVAISQRWTNVLLQTTESLPHPYNPNSGCSLTFTHASRLDLCSNSQWEQRSCCRHPYIRTPLTHGHGVTRAIRQQNSVAGLSDNDSDRVPHVPKNAGCLSLSLCVIVSPPHKSHMNYHCVWASAEEDRPRPKRAKSLLKHVSTAATLSAALLWAPSIQTHYDQKE